MTAWPDWRKWPNGATGSPSDLERFIENFNAAGKRRARSGARHGALNRLLDTSAQETDPQLARRLAGISLSLEDIDDKLTRLSDAEATQKRALASANLKSDVASAVARLDLDTANRLLDSVGALKKQLGQVESKIDRANDSLDTIQARVACSDATSENIVLSVRTRNAPRTLALIKCLRANS